VGCSSLSCLFLASNSDSRLAFGADLLAATLEMDVSGSSMHSSWDEDLVGVGVSSGIGAGVGIFANLGWTWVLDTSDWEFNIGTDVPILRIRVST